MKIKTIKSLSIGEYKSLNSKFLGYLYPIREKGELDSIIAQLRKEHPKARHFCYAYRIGYVNEEFRANDDGEPSGSAGKPILNQLYSSELKNALIVVVRYFGGTKLGVPGLIEAYKEASKAAIMMAEIVEEEEMQRIIKTLTHEEYYEFIKKIKSLKIDILETIFHENTNELKLNVPVSQLDLLN